jgi:hypothetical protein
MGLKILIEKIHQNKKSKFLTAYVRKKESRKGIPGLQLRVEKF